MDCLDSSVVVKWFKEDEELRPEAIGLLRLALKNTNEYVTSEWLLLEVVRALVKSGTEPGGIHSACSVLNALVRREALTEIPVGSVRELAKELEIELNLHAADAVHLATAIESGCSAFWTEDDHLHKRKVTEYAGGFGLSVKRLGRYSRTL
ncbi:MAG: type II toxin-antitoxin system VapC family toxin [Candidatus Altiarchaeia archaeon]